MGIDTAEGDDQEETELKHTYPSNYPPGSHWAVTEAWEILDAIKPGLISDDIRAYLAGRIAGKLMMDRKTYFDLVNCHDADRIAAYWSDLEKKSKK